MTDKKDKLEKALSDKDEKKGEKGMSGMSEEMEIGFHQGSLNSLLNERNGLIKIVQQIENVIQAHIKRLEELGVKVRTSSEKRE
jgi:DNA polymerase I-like protein with 3'-5' exonuclease and polymerase domains